MSRLLAAALTTTLIACGPRDERLPDASMFLDGPVDGGALDAGSPSSALPLPGDAGEWLTFFEPIGTNDFDIDGIAVNASGEAYGSGFVEGGVRFFDLGRDGVRRENGVSATVGKDLLLFKLSKTGGVVWAQVVPSTGREGNGYDLAVDPVDDVLYTSGSFSGSLNVGGGLQLVSACDEGGAGKQNGYGQMLLLKHDRDGRILWARQSNSTTAVAGGNEVALDGARNVIQSGTFGAMPCAAGRAVLTLGAHTLANDGQADAYAATFDRLTGEVLGAPVHVGGAGYQRAQAVDTGTVAGVAPESVLLGVSYRGPTTLYSRTRAPISLDTTAATNDWDMVVAKYDVQGELVWQRSFGSSTVLTVQGTLVQEQLKGLVRDSRGDVLVSGTLTGSVTVAGTTYAPNLLSPGARSMGFLAKLAGRDGAVLWFRTFSGEQGINTCCEVAVDERDVTYLTPQVYGANLHLSGGQPFIALGATDPSTKLGVILRYDTNGSALDARHLGGWQTSGTSSTSSELALSPSRALTWTGTLEGALRAPVPYDSAGAQSEFVARFQY